jgi:HTH-type transcriptional regulator/antitoxin HigA
MDIRPIRTNEDYRAALAEIEALWNASEGSDEAVKLDLLAILVENYEAKRWPVTEPNWDPVDILHYAIEEMGAHANRACGASWLAVPRIRNSFTTTHAHS